MYEECRFLSLPHELLLQILEDLYQPWSLNIEFRRDKRREQYYGKAVVRAIPVSPCAALLGTCKSIHQLAKTMMISAFSGIVNSRDPPWIFALVHLLNAPRWIQLVPHVKKLNLSNRTYGLVMSEQFIALLPGLRQVELFELLGFRVVVDELAGMSDREISALPNEYFEKQASMYLPEIPVRLPFVCNGGAVELLVHAHFDTRRVNTDLPVIDVCFRVGSDKWLYVMNKVWIRAKAATRIPQD